MANIKKIKIGSTVYDIKDTVSGYTTNVGTVTKVNNTSPDSNGNVTISIPAAQIQSDWSQTDNTSKDYIKNKPSIPTDTGDLTNTAGFVTATYDSTNEQLVLG